MNGQNGTVLEGFPEITGKFYLRFDYLKAAMAVIACLSSAGIFALVLHWYDWLYFQSFYSEEPDISQADYVGFITERGQRVYCRLFTSTESLVRHEQPVQRLMFKNGVHKFFYDPVEDRFMNVGKVVLRLLRTQLTQDPDFYQNYAPNSPADIRKLQGVYGPNRLRLQHKNLIWHTFLCLLTPLNAYEITASIACYFFELYVFCFQLIFYIIIQCVAIIIGDRHKINIINEIADRQSTAWVVRLDDSGARQLLQVSSHDLVVGDVVLIYPSTQINCDIVLVSGVCNLNESMLTGETTPVLKRPMEKGAPVKDDHILFAGTECLAVAGSEFAVGVVSGTGWNTFKGSLLDAMVNAPKVLFKFDKDFLIVCTMVMVIYLALNGYVIYKDLADGWISWRIIIFRVLLVIVCAYSPSAMVTFFILNFIVERRLSKAGVFTMMFDKIKEAGRVKVLAFDKTGTLTEDFVEVAGTILASPDSKHLNRFHADVAELDDGHHSKETLEFFGICNSLIYVKGEIRGDILDVQQYKQSPFQLKDNQNKAAGSITDIAQIDQVVRETRQSASAGSKKEDPSQDGLQQTFLPSPDFTRTYGLNPDAEYKLKKIFTFDHERKRMSVLVERPGSADGQRQRDRVIFCKGAPESVIKLCNQSTVPTDFQEKALDLTLKGYRILAFGYRLVGENEEVKWAEEAERDLTFLGLVLMQNQVKPRTEETMATLIRCNVEVLMITGDNVYTGINAALASGMVNPQQKLYVCQLVGGKELKWFVLSKEELLKSLTFINAPHETQGAMLEKSLEKSLSHNSQKSRERRQTGSGRHMTTVDKGINEILNDCEENDCVLALEADAYELMVRKFQAAPATRARILRHTRIYGRTKPIQKQRVVRHLKELYAERDITVGFVGDGSNDSIAFKEANMGLCVGSQDAAITASFSSAVSDISAVLPVLCLGRFTVESMLQVMKIALFNGFVSSLVITVVNAYGLSFTNFDLLNDRMQFLGLYICVCLTMHRDQLNGFLPKAGFLNWSIITETLTAVGLGIAFVFLSFALLVTRMENKRPEEIVPTLKGIDYENHFFVESKYMLVMFSLLDLCVAYAFHRALPFKQPFHTNKFLLAAYAVYLTLHTLPFYIRYIGSYSFVRAWHKFRTFPLTDDDLKYKALSFTAVFGIFIVVAIRMVQENQLRAGLESQAKRRSRWSRDIHLVN